MNAIKEDRVWDELISLVCSRMTSMTGNVFGDRQRPMVEARLRRHLRDIKVAPENYSSYWQNHKDQEDKLLVALLTTHFTSFFREFLHFEWLATELPKLVLAAKAQGRNDLRIWSAACSKGQEVWSIAMWLQHHLPTIAPGMKWSVHGTDIDSNSVKEATNGVYHSRELETSPRHLWEPYWQKGTGDIGEWYKIKKSIREHCTFGVANLLELPKTSSHHYDVIFCRNVLIYFDKAGQEKAVTGLLRQLQPHGALISGVSESLAAMGLGLKSLSASVYGLADYKPKLQVADTVTPMVKKLTIPVPLRVLCVDDSPTVLNILKRVLASSEFEIVGTAGNGEEAKAKILALKPDVITLDLHMPVMDGFALIKQTDTARKYPVVVVSTVERQNSSMVHPLFEAGVCDFLEKPSFENLQQIGEELRQKLKMAWLSKQRGLVLKPIETSSRINSVRPLGRIILNAGLADRDAIRSALKLGSWKKDEVIIQLSGEDHLWEDWAKNLLNEFSGIDIKVKKNFDWVRDNKISVFLHYHGGSLNGLHHATDQHSVIILEEGEWPANIRALAQDMFPSTSFVYMTEKYMEGK